MTANEYAEWKIEMARNRGHWKVDPVHDGDEDRMLLMYVTEVEDSTAGQYIMVQQNGRASAGSFEGAEPHMGEAIYHEGWAHDFANYSTAVARVIERTGANILMALLFGHSPYRTVA